MLTHLLLASSSSILTVSGSLASSVSTEEREEEMRDAVEPSEGLRFF